MNLFKMVNNKWSDNDMSLFLDLYKNYQCLWNTKEEMYRNSQARVAALERIIREMGKSDLTINDLKIKNIRSIYTRELAKVRKSEKSGTGTDDIYKPQLKWFAQADLLLRSVSQSRQSQSNMDNSQLSHNEEADYFIENNENSTTLDENLATSSSSKSAPIKRTVQTELRSSSRELKMRRSLAPIEKAIYKLESISQANSNNASDEYTIYGQHIATQLRALPPVRALICQEEFQRILTRERINSFKSDAARLTLSSGSEYTCSNPSVTSPTPSPQIYSFPSSPAIHDTTGIEDSNASTWENQDSNILIQAVQSIYD